MRTIALQAIRALVLLCVAPWAPDAHAYRSYDDGAGAGCVQCHNGFRGGNGPLHFQHRTRFGVTTCNVCHPNGGGSTPVLTYASGPGGGLGCAGCHGRDYGETSPNSGLPKATAYGLRQFHVGQGVTACGTAGCHQPGALGHPDPFPPLLGEHVAPPYFDALFSVLMDPCSSADEDLPFDADSVGLDNDGDGVADWPADADCVASVTTTTTSTVPTTTMPFDCGSAPAVGCIAPGRGALVVTEKTAGKEKLKVTLKNLQAAVTPGQFGDPVAGSTAYNVCVYDAANQLSGQYTVARAGDECAGKPCWSTVRDRGYKYGDKSLTADGIQKITLSGGDTGKGKIVLTGRNKASTMPTGLAAALQDETSATVQLVTSDAACFGLSLTEVKTANGTVFSAAGP